MLQDGDVAAAVDELDRAVQDAAEVSEALSGFCWVRLRRWSPTSIPRRQCPARSVQCGFTVPKACASPARPELHLTLGAEALPVLGSST